METPKGWSTRLGLTVTCLMMLSPYLVPVWERWLDTVVVPVVERWVAVEEEPEPEPEPVTEPDEEPTGIAGLEELLDLGNRLPYVDSMSVLIPARPIPWYMDSTLTK